MQRKNDGAVEWLEFDLLQAIPGLRHGVFLRHGGVSQPPFGALNVKEGLGDADQNVQTNLQRVQRTLGADRLICATQVHGRELAEIDSVKSAERPVCDGLFTSEPGIGLIIRQADCQAAIFYDPRHHAVACVHSGWRGSVQNIYAETVRRMSNRYQSRPEELLVCISPSLGPDRAEFVNYRTELPEAFLEFQIRPNYFDFWEISRRQLIESGVQPSRIEIAQICTYNAPADFFSYRRDGVTGRHSTAVVLSRETIEFPRSLN
jgi:purine-nucleoside/S-methyl-5'-thioadenosine phosphorylase / adenosine deaminase